MIWLTLILGACAAGFVQGVSGFAFSMVALAFWAWQIEPITAAPLVIICSFVGQAFSIRLLKNPIDWTRTAPFLIGGALGVPLGVAVLPHINVALFQLTVGLFLLLYCSAALFFQTAQHLHESPWRHRTAGFLGGVTGGLCGMAGAIPSLWCGLLGWSKHQQRTVLQPFFLAMHGLSLSMYLISGKITSQVLQMSLLAIPAMLIPAWLGTRLYRTLSEQKFRQVVLILLLLSGLALCSSGLSMY